METQYIYVAFGGNRGYGHQHRPSYGRHGPMKYFTMDFTMNPSGSAGHTDNPIFTAFASSLIPLSREHKMVCFTSNPNCPTYI